MPGTNSSGLKAATVVRTGEGDRLGYLVGPVYRAAQAVAVLLLVPVDVLVDDDRVVDDDAEHQDESEEGEHVDGDKSRPDISAIAPRNEIGIPRLTQNARRSSRNNASTRKTSANPAEVQAAAVGPRPEDQVLELRSAVGLPDRPQQDLHPMLEVLERLQRQVEKVPRAARRIEYRELPQPGQERPVPALGLVAPLHPRGARPGGFRAFQLGCDCRPLPLPLRTTTGSTSCRIFWRSV